MTTPTQALAKITADDLWRNEAVMALNAELGLTMDQLLRFVHALAALSHPTQAAEPVQAAPQAASPAPGGEVLAWIRLCSNGTYEGPLADCDRRMDDVRKRSGAWTPLVAAPQAQPQAAAGLTEREERAAFQEWYRQHGNNCQGIRWVDALVWSVWQARAALSAQPATPEQPAQEQQR